MFASGPTITKRDKNDNVAHQDARPVEQKAAIPEFVFWSKFEGDEVVFK